MRYLSICSGIEAASVAWAPFGWQAAGYSEIEPFPRAVLQQRLGAVPVDWDHRHRDGSNAIPLFGDFTKIEAHHVGPVDLLVGGTPCQSFSVAGKRLGLDDPRGHLTLEFLALARRLRPRWIVWENVPGVLSDDGGRTFGTFLGILGQLGYGWAFRVIDAQFARVGGFERAVPQRRRRVFVVGHLGDPARAAAVLFDRESLRGNPAPRREAGEGSAAATAPCLTSSGRGVERTGETRGQDPVVAVMSSGQANAETRTDGGAPSLTCLHEAPIVAHALRAEGFDAREDRTGRQNLVPIAIRTAQTSANGHGIAEGVAHTLDLASGQAIAIQGAATRENPSSGPDGVGVRADGAAYTLEARSEVQAVAFTESADCLYAAYGTKWNGNAAATSGGLFAGNAWAVRRLTPTECERLQGFPDGWTDIEWRKKPAPDGPRYKALGNSMAVNVMRFIGERIALVDAIDAKDVAA